MSPASSRMNSTASLKIDGCRTFCRKTFCRKTFCRKTFCRRHFAEGTFCRRTLCRTNISSNGQFDKRTFRRKDILPKRQLAENREILGDVTRTTYDWLQNRTSQSYNQLDDRNFDSKVSFVLYSFTFLTNRSEICLHRFRYIYACLFTTWRQGTFLKNDSSTAQTI